MRVSALWALKHLITMSDTAIKIQAFEGLGKEFLTQILSGDSSNLHRLATANALGEKVNILNTEEPHMDIDTPMASSDEEPVEVSNSQRRTVRLKYSLSEDHTARLRPLRNAEQNIGVRARRDDIRIQHHALDFVRNMIAEPNAQGPELVDKVLGTIGSEKFFEILVSKLKPKASNASGFGATAGKRPTLTTPGGTTGNSATQNYIDQSQYNHPDVLQSAIFTLVHIANGKPYHRHLILCQQGLLSAMIPLYTHPDPKIRVACIWMASNILWVENSNDDSPAQERAKILRAAGIEEKCREATRDVDLDTRERAKSVVDCFAKLLDSGGKYTPGGSGNWDR
jgi:hypothetical protein